MSLLLPELTHFDSNFHLLNTFCLGCSLTKLAISLALCLSMSLSFLQATSPSAPGRALRHQFRGHQPLCAQHIVRFSSPALIPLHSLYCFSWEASHFFVLTTQDHFFSWQFLQNMNAYEAVDLFFFQDIYPTLYQGKIICFWYYLCTFAKIPCCLSLSPGTECALEYMLVHLLSHSADKRHLFKRWFILS